MVILRGRGTQARESTQMIPSSGLRIVFAGVLWLIVSNVLVPVFVPDVFTLVGVNTLLMGVAMLATIFLARLTGQRHIKAILEKDAEIWETHRELLQRLVRVAQMRDGDTGLHITRMARLCEVVALAYGYSEEEAEMILLASQLHDIGKVGIPDSILLKPGALTPEERAQMQQHVEIGVKILDGGRTRLVQLAESIARTHHEKWAGGGYPCNLEGQQIPVEGRIAALCDVFDALVSKRPYKDAWSLKDAVAEIERESGRHFDPDVVEAFLRAMPAIQGIIEECAGERASQDPIKVA